MVCYLELLELVRRSGGITVSEAYEEGLGFGWAVINYKDHHFLQWYRIVDGQKVEVDEEKVQRLYAEGEWYVELNDKAYEWLAKHNAEGFTSTDFSPARKKEKKLGRKLKWRDE